MHYLLLHVYDIIIMHTPHSVRLLQFYVHWKLVHWSYNLQVLQRRPIVEINEHVSFVLANRLHPSLRPEKSDGHVRQCAYIRTHGTCTCTLITVFSRSRRAANPSAWRIEVVHDRCRRSTPTPTMTCRSSACVA